MLLYSFFRYIIFVSLLFVAGISLTLLLYLTNPYGYAALGDTRTFGATMMLLYMFSILSVVLTSLASNPLIASGDETLHMPTPMSHVSIQGNLLLIAAMSILRVIALDGTAGHASAEVARATSAILGLANLSMLVSIFGFYQLRRRARASSKSLPE